MKALTLAGNGTMPALGLGTWKSKADDVYRAVAEALRIGYRHIDCAHIYGNEAEVGKALAEAFDAGTVERDDLWITSKLWNDCHAPADVEPALETTLANLGLEALDLYLVHWPVALRKGASFPLEAADMISLDELPLAATWSAMEALAASGRCKHIGVSNCSVAKLEALVASAARPPEVNQIEMHPYLQQPAMLDYCKANNIALTAYSPLGSPDRPATLLEQGEPVLLEDPTIGAIAKRHSASPAQVLISWAIERGTSVIPKSVNPERLAQNFAASELSLTEAEMAEIGALDRHRRYVSGAFWAVEGSSYSLASLWDE